MMLPWSGEPNTTPLQIRNGNTGEVVTSFLCIGPRVEGLRYMVNAKGEERFVRTDFSEAFPLPYPSRYLQYGNIGAKNESWYCRDGRIPLAFYSEIVIRFLYTSVGVPYRPSPIYTVKV